MKLGTNLLELNNLVTVSMWKCVYSNINGIGMVAIVPERATEDTLQQLKAMNEKAFVIGEIPEYKSTNKRIQWV